MKLFRVFFYILIFLLDIFAEEFNKKEDILAIHPLTMLLLKNSTTITLTKEEKEFLQKYPKIIIGSDTKWIPYVYETKDKRVIGFNIDILEKINKLIGSNFKFELDTHKNIIKKVKEKKIDGIISSFISEENNEYLNFSIPFLKQSINIVVKHGNPLRIKSIKDLENKTIVIQNGNYFLENIVKETFTNSKIIYKDLYEDVFEEVVFGQADATINEGPSNFLKNEKDLPYLNRAFSFDKKVEMFFSIRKDMPEAISILNKGIKAIPNNEIEVLYHKWFGTFNFDIHSSGLSKIDKEYINKIKKVKVCTDSTWYAFNKENSDEESITNNILNIVLKKVGLEKDLIFTATWEESLLLLKKGDCDLISAISKNSENEKFIKFTKPYTNYPIMLITHVDTSYLYNLNELKDKKIAIIKDNAVLNKYKYSNKEIVYVSTPYEGLKMVQEKKVFVYVDLLPKFIYTLDKVENVKINREIDSSVDISMGLRTTDNHLFHIIENSLSSITDIEKNKIFSKLFKENYRKNVNKELIVQVILLLLAAVFLVLFWNIQLKKSVKKALQKNKQQESLLYYYSTQDAMKDLVGNISHQWKQPINELSSVLFYLETKLYLKQEITNEDIKENTLKSRAIIDYLSKTVNIFSNYYVDKKTETNIKILTLLEQSIFITDGSFRKLNTKISLDIKDKNLKVKGEFLQQVILSILNNARNIIVERKIGDSLINIKLYKKDIYSILEIEDNFGGITNIDTIFNLGTTNSKKGTGLGLFISKRIIQDKYQGEISVKNKKNGAVFIIKLPIDCV
ncbi:transporter substrate-binding domain-containing protein [Malaciobacter mytili]|uniref:transporter substrate-binding domain-containing protein n=1 Tax=Malaciobacter mytili TaxID=603050 RepID=UPI003A885943